MKKGIIITVVTVIIIGIAAVGAFFVAFNGLFHREAKGLILYGSDKQLSESKKIQAKNIENSYETKVKIIDKDLMIIREKDMNEFCKHQIVNELKDDGQSEVVSQMKSAKETPVYYGKDSKTTIDIAGKKLKVTSGGDVIIGNSRIFNKGYVVVSDSEYKEFKTNESGMMLLKLKKAADKEITNCNYEQVQLVDIK